MQSDKMRFSKTDRILVLGSCFAANIGAKLLEEGYDVCLNPFGTLFNPASIASSLRRLASGKPFVREDCVQMGAGSSLWCSFSHYTKFARPTQEEFLSFANERLAEASAFFASCNKVIVTFGTAYVFRHLERAAIVSNCLKRPAREFERYRLEIDDIVSDWSPMLSECSDSGLEVGGVVDASGVGGALDASGAGILAGKDVLFTVSPIRHLADTAHGNQLSKSTLLLSIDRLLSDHRPLSNVTPQSERAYFPAYEIVLDDLRDYSWYAEDKVHPSAEAVEVIWSRFRNECLSC